MKLLLNFDYLLKIYFPELIGKFKVDFNFLNLFNEENRPIYICIDEIAIRNLFLQFDLNQDGFVDFSKIIKLSALFEA